MATDIKEIKRYYRHQRLRKKLTGTSERPRLYIHRSLKNMQAHIVDDMSRKILCGVSTLDKDLGIKTKNRGNVKAAERLGEAIAAKAKEKGITRICFDRSGYLFHGCVKSFADAARKGGLEF